MTGRILVIGGGRHVPQLREVPTITCSNCGHEVDKDERLENIGFRWVNPRTSVTRCGNCGLVTMQRAYTSEFKAGEFLIVRPFNTIRKGPRHAVQTWTPAANSAAAKHAIPGGEGPGP